MADPPTIRRELIVLLLAGAALVTANSERLSLPALDDCFYARKGVEMARSGGFFTVTWNGLPTFQNPPLQIWLLAKSITVFGENDFSARLPAMVMAVGLLFGVYRIGVLTVGAPAGVGAVALLLLSPYLLNNARRCMMEIPLALWVTLFIWVFLEGRRRPRLQLVVALPLGAAILTKSVLGLLPIAIVVAGALVQPPLREPFRKPWFWLGTLGGLVLGASWTVHQYLSFGPGFLQEHYAREILARSTERPDFWRMLSSYPLILLTSYQPVVLPALVGAVSLWKRRRDSGPAEASVLLVIWIAVPLLAYSLSSARSPRYLFPVFPPLALCASDWLTRLWPRVAALLRNRLAPLLLVAGAVVFWVRPSLLSRNGTAVFKEDRQVRARVPEGEPIAFLATRYEWGLANPLLYYTERCLEAPRASAAEAVALARGRRSRLLMAERGRLAELGETGYSVVLEGSGWVLVELSRGAPADGETGFVDTAAAAR
jgi:4-amino-4-deoxy-L-arabinose transferase-like glycosyltransferase